MKHALPAALILSLFLAACGSTPASVAPISSQTLSGTITGLSSDRSTLTVAGTSVKLSGGLSSASLHALSDTTTIRKNGKASTAHALSVGQSVTVQETGGVATEVDVHVELRGEITSVSASSLVVAGQTVKVDASTRIELASDDDTAATPHVLADLKAGTFVEVSGQRDASGAILASNIEAKSVKELHDDGEDEDSEVKGVVANLDPTAHTFTVGSTTVTYDPAKVEGTLAQGVEVEVEGTFDAATSILTASKVRVEEEGESEGHGGIRAGGLVRLEARVESVDPASQTFTVQGLTVEYAHAAVSGHVTLRAEVKVRGTVDASTPTLIHASTVVVDDD